MRYIIGIDEVGRGCLAGPVTVTALAIPEDFDFSPPAGGFDFGLSSPEFNSKSKNLSALTSRPNLILRDSKKLSPRQREEWIVRLEQVPEIKFATKSVKPNLIDRINIANAANLAVERALKELFSKYEILPDDCSIYLDGGLYIKGRRHQEKNFKSASTVVKGDELVPAVSLASIVAKVYRDKYMDRLSRSYPQFLFNKHKGYATKVHREAIKEHGITEFHRLSFLKKILA